MKRFAQTIKVAASVLYFFVGLGFLAALPCLLLILFFASGHAADGTLTWVDVAFASRWFWSAACLLLSVAVCDVYFRVRHTYRRFGLVP